MFSTNSTFFMQNKANFQKSQVSVTNLLTREYEQMDTWSSEKNEANSKPIYRGLTSGEAGFHSAGLLMERIKSSSLNFHSKNNLTLCRYSLKYWVFDS